MDRPPAVLIPGILELQYLENRGAAFGMLQHRQLLFIALSAAVLVFGSWLFLFRIPDNVRFRPLNLVCLLLLSGALGNLIDRIFRGGAVVDYLDVQLFDFAVFNFADCFITVGTALLAAYILFFSEKDDKRLKSAAPQEEHHDDP
jgi:signal peptidase II